MGGERITNDCAACGAKRVSIAGIAIENGRVFIARRLPGGDMGGKWELPGGKVEGDESCETAIVREFLEEFGVAVSCGAFLGESSFVHKGITRTLKAYGVSFPPDFAKLPTFKLIEHSEWRWASPSEIRLLDFTPSDLGLLPFVEPLCRAGGC